MNHKSLLQACEKGDTDKVEKALAADSSRVDTADENGNSLLMIASWCGHQSIVTILLRHNPSLDAVNDFGFNALILAVHYEQLEITRLLLDAGASVNQVLSADVADGRRTKNALLAAAYKKNVDLIRLLLERGADPEVYIPDLGTTLRDYMESDADLAKLIPSSDGRELPEH